MGPEDKGAKVQFSQYSEQNLRRPLDFYEGFEAFKPSLSPFRPLDGFRESHHDFRGSAIEELSASEKHPSPETDLLEVCQQLRLLPRP